MNTILTKSPTESRMFIWFAQYSNDEYFYEYNEDFNAFDEIQRDILSYFGMIGMDMIMKYEISTGLFNICNRRIGFVFKDDNGNETALTNSGNIYNDCISYKSAETVLIGRQQGGSVITSYNFGYKVKLDKFNLKVIVHIPLDGKVNIDIDISSDEDINGDLFIIKNEQTVQRNNLKLIKNRTASVNWQVV